ncbi:hypothetical protein KQX54_011282 [Cotesia glomerata]|uniref:Endonuclease/exonuclease/phosphatase domain-containing protein n=1 Tax=Cotesia glomerata TaxID=32391 RepID=A0AAV7IG42_COTGL|nr:hypothetical protein KQX54_011282 [Cotesia glomerata]
MSECDTCLTEKALAESAKLPTQVTKRSFEEISAEPFTQSPLDLKKPLMANAFDSPDTCEKVDMPEDMAWIGKLFANLSKENKSLYNKLDTKIEEISSEHDLAVGLLKADTDKVSNEVNDLKEQNPHEQSVLPGKRQCWEYCVNATKIQSARRGSGGLITLVNKNKWRSEEIASSKDWSFILIHINDNLRLIVESLYSSPTADIQKLLVSLKLLLEELQVRFENTSNILGGDLNARVGDTEPIPDELSSDIYVHKHRKTSDAFVNNRGRILSLFIIKIKIGSTAPKIANTKPNRDKFKCNLDTKDSYILYLAALDNMNYMSEQNLDRKAQTLIESIKEAAEYAKIKTSPRSSTVTMDRKPWFDKDCLNAKKLVSNLLKNCFKSNFDSTDRLIYIEQKKKTTTSSFYGKKPVYQVYSRQLHGP